MKILIKDGRGTGKPRPLEEGYADEAQLQEFLRNDAELIPVGEIELGSPPLLCIGSEVRSRGKSDSATTEGWLDLLYVDESARLTIIEAKLGKNTESHREVVGQILEYAAFASSWTGSDLEERAASFFNSPECPAEYSGLQLHEAVTRFLEAQDAHEGKAFDYAEFIDELENKINNGRMRLVVAIDEPPDSLIRIVQFVNQFSVHFDLYVFQLKRFHDRFHDSDSEQDIEQDIFVPAIFGRVAQAQAKRRGRKKTWDERAFFEDAATRLSTSDQEIVRKLYDFACEKGKAKFGTGESGSFTFRVSNDGTRWLSIFVVYNEWDISLRLSDLAGRQVPEDVLSRFREAVNALPDVNLPEDAKEPTIPFKSIAAKKHLALFKRAVDDLVEQALATPWAKGEVDN